MKESNSPLGRHPWFVFKLLISLVGVVALTISMLTIFLPALNGTQSHSTLTPCYNNVPEFVTLSNSSNGVRRIGSECFSETYSFYESYVECGTFAIHCYEREEPVARMRTSTVCWNWKTGEVC